MTNAILVGPKESSKGQEKPTMYSTVINRHPTVIRHQIPQPTNVGVNAVASSAFAVDPAQTLADHKLQNGAYSIPVQISSGAIKDPTLSGYETPNFIHKGEKKIQETSEETMNNIDPAKFLKSNMEKDIGNFLAQFDNAKDKSERTKSLIEGKKQLQNQMSEISKNIQKEIRELLHAKEVALKLSNLNNYYTTKIRRDQLSALKLSDVITIKNVLRNKIHKEIQGFRTAPSQYNELDNVNPSDIAIIMKNIKLALGQ